MHFSFKAAAPKLSFLQLTETGYFFCEGCDHIVDVLSRGEPYQRCARCRSYDVRWVPGIGAIGKTGAMTVMSRAKPRGGRD